MKRANSKDRSDSIGVIRILKLTPQQVKARIEAYKKRAEGCRQVAEFFDSQAREFTQALKRAG